MTKPECLELLNQIDFNLLNNIVKYKNHIVTDIQLIYIKKNFIRWRIFYLDIIEHEGTILKKISSVLEEELLLKNFKFYILEEI